MPIHNEAEYLVYSLPSIYSLNPAEVILLLDNCTDDSKKIVMNTSNFYSNNKETRIIEVKKVPKEWTFRVAYLRRLGFCLAKNDIILNTDADIVLDPNIKRHLDKIGFNNLKLLGFSFFDYPFNTKSLVKLVINRFTPFSGMGGLYAFSKKAWLNTENIDYVKLIRAEDTYLRMNLEKNFRSANIFTKSLHLRPSESKSRNYLRGVEFWKVAEYSFLKMLLYTIVTFRPEAMKGYINSRFEK